MRTLTVLSTMLFLVMLSGTAMAQPGSGPRMRGENKQGIDHKGPMGHKGHIIPNLTDEQKAKIKELRLAHYKVVQPLRNQMGELKARQKSLSTTDKPDMKAINANIDEITKLQNQLMKAMAAHTQEIRSLLTDEQKMIFDSKKGKKAGRGMKHAMREPSALNEVTPATAI